MAIVGTEMLLANEPNEDQTGVDVIVRGGFLADRQDLGAAADRGDAARGGGGAGSARGSRSRTT
jgi:hypothetical protein